MRHILSIVYLALWCLAGPAHPADIQFHTSSARITGVSNDTIPAATGFTVVTIPEAISEITWPVPSGCSVGLPQWTRVTNAGTLAANGTGMAVRTDIFWFTTTSPLLTGCHVVATAAELWDLVNHTLESKFMNNTWDLMPFLAVLNVRTHSLCPSTNSSQTCIDARGAMETLNGDGLSAPADLKDFLEDAVTLKADAEVFISSHGL